MKTERKLVLALKTMMAKYPLEEISVVMLTNKCHVNRQTFYYHFHDIYDLLTLLFLDEKIPNIESCRSPKEMLECIFNYYEENSSFVDATIKSAAKDLFIEFIFNTCFQCFTRFVDAVDIAYKVEKNNKKNVVKFYSAAFSELIVNYLETSPRKTLKGLISCFDFLIEGELTRAIQVLASKDL